MEKSNVFEKIAVAKNKGSQANGFKFLRPHRIVLSGQGNQQVIDKNILMFKRLFKFHLEMRLTINRIMDSWINAIPDSGNLS